MAYRLKAGEPVGDAVVRIAQQQLRRALAEIDDADLDRHVAVHQVRKRCKKVRALLRMVRPALGASYGPENACFRDAAAQLSGVRDAQTRVETFDDLVAHFGSALDPGFVAQVRARLVTRRSEAVDMVEVVGTAETVEGETDVDGRLQAVRVVLEEACARSAHWRLEEEGFAAIAGGVRKTYRRGRRAMAAAYAAPTAEAFHEWRKRTKYFGHQLRLLRPLWPAVFRAQGETAGRLADLLGDDHDLAVLAAMLEQEPELPGAGNAADALHGLIHQRRQMLQAQARPLGERLYAEKPAALIARLECCWCAWQREQQSTQEASSP